MFCNFLERMLTVQENKLKTQCYVYEKMKKIRSKVLNKFSLAVLTAPTAQKVKIACSQMYIKLGPCLDLPAQPAVRQPPLSSLIKDQIFAKEAGSTGMFYAKVHFQFCAKRFP